MTNEISMTRARRTAPRLATLGAILSMVLTTSALRAQQPPPYCSNSTMSGTYVVSGTGTAFSPSGVGTLIATVGKVTYDGQGGGQSIQTASVGGTIVRQATATAVYTVNADCTGSKTFTSSTGQVTHFDFVISPSVPSITWIVTDAGRVFMGNAVRLDRQD
jgi:hypothetical protein